MLRNSIEHEHSDKNSLDYKFAKFQQLEEFPAVNLINNFSIVLISCLNQTIASVSSHKDHAEMIAEIHLNGRFR